MAAEDRERRITLGAMIALALADAILLAFLFGGRP